MTTLLVSPEQLDGDEVRVSGGPYRHLFRARRMAAGERLRMVDGRGRARWAEVTRVDRSAATLALGEPAPAHEPPFRLELLVAVLRPERAAWLVEKATEIGLAAVRFLHAERAPRTFGAGTFERLGRVAAAAVEQCGRALLPEVTGVHEWSELERLAAALPDRRMLDPGAEEAGWPAPAAGGVALLVGPEGGWTDAERAAARVLGFRPAGLGPRTLRTETAALAAAARLLLD